MQVCVARGITIIRGNITRNHVHLLKQLKNKSLFKSAIMQQSMRKIFVDGMDTADEQHSLDSGGDRDGGAGLQLIPPLPTQEEQQNTIQEAEDEKASAFAISQEYSYEKTAETYVQIYKSLLKK